MGPNHFVVSEFFSHLVNNIQHSLLQVSNYHHRNLLILITYDFRFNNISLLNKPERVELLFFFISDLTSIKRLPFPKKTKDKFHKRHKKCCTNIFLNIVSYV